MNIHGHHASSFMKQYSLSNLCCHCQGSGSGSGSGKMKMAGTKFSTGNRSLFYLEALPLGIASRY